MTWYQAAFLMGSLVFLQAVFVYHMVRSFREKIAWIQDDLYRIYSRLDRIEEQLTKIEDKLK